MAMTTSFGALLLLLMGGQAGVPLGLPPLPEDPVMARVAPADCLWYFSWSGVAEPNPNSANHTEQLLAEPEVRDFVRAVGKAFSAAIRKGAPPSPQGKILGAEGPGLIHTLLTHPTAAFVSKAGVGPLGLNVEAGIVVGTGDETDHVRSTLEKLEQTVLGPSAGGAAQTGNGQAAVASWHKLPSPPGAPTLEWGFRDKYLIVGIGEGSADAIAKRAAAGEVPDWLAALKKRLPVARQHGALFQREKSARRRSPTARPSRANDFRGTWRGQSSRIRQRQRTGRHGLRQQVVAENRRRAERIVCVARLRAADGRRFGPDSQGCVVCGCRARAAGQSVDSDRGSRQKDRSRRRRPACRRRQGNGGDARISLAGRFFANARRLGLRLQFAWRRGVAHHGADDRRAGERP